MPTFPLLVAKLAPVVLLNAPITATPVEDSVAIAAEFTPKTSGKFAVVKRLALCPLGPPER